ncbi:cell growth-regulating nucleolar protein-like [Macrobrachium nipponense]|uniref:cell growth-regulating nucleolar protein-like n=1 Tax=Macrobrachium nipponense TaxID=159736 RepID=UPI0030C85E6B
MVFFVCGGCGETLKKNQVEKHTFKCRSCQSLTCMDCSKEFWGNDYTTHTSCVSENEKYGGINYVAKENIGQKKQEEWVTLLKDKIASTKAINPRLENLFHRLLQYDNIPRKKAKFLNFLRSSKLGNEALAEEAWKYFEDVQQILSKRQNDQNSKPNQKNTDSQKVEEDVNSATQIDSSTTPEATQEEPQRKSKRERKEERQKKQTKVQKKDKRKRPIEDEGETQETEKPKKKKKATAAVKEEDEKANQENVEPEKAENGLEESMAQEGEDSEGASGHSPFKWKKAIHTILKDAPEEGMKMKKLKRKLFALYVGSKSEAAHRKSDVEIDALISKKLQRRNDKYVVVKDRVKLKNTS